MTETQINCLLTVAEEMSFSAAAHKLFVTQSAVSKNISSLEHELGFMLFDRTGKQIRQTDECRYLLKFLQRSKQDYEQTLGNIRSLRAQHGGEVRIGIVDTWSTTQFYDELTAYFSSVYPNMHLHVAAYGVDEMIAVLRSGEIDVGITYEFMTTGQHDFSVKPFLSLDAGLLYANSGAEKTSLADFKDMSFILKVEGTEHVRRLLTDLCQAEHFTPKFINSKGAGYEITEVRHDNGVLFCCEWHFWKESGLFRYFPLSFSLPTKLIYLPGEENSAKNLFVNEVELMISAHRDSA